MTNNLLAYDVKGIKDQENLIPVGSTHLVVDVGKKPEIGNIVMCGSKVTRYHPGVKYTGVVTQAQTCKSLLD